jgi:hypothetical protein
MEAHMVEPEQAAEGLTEVESAYFGRLMHGIGGILRIANAFCGWEGR